MIGRPTCAFAATCLCIFVGSARSNNAAAKVQFNRDVRPILSDKCFQCHGPDSKKRQAELRLDIRDEAIAAGAIEPGKPADSVLVRRVTSADDDERMPPASAKLERLTEAEVRTLRQWIDEGAEYEDHWSFIPLKPVEAPENGAATPIDALIQRDLAQLGLRQQPQADRHTLIRRVTFDLTGLPPSPAEIDAFVNDSAPDAYERLVDRLLASQHYGERMAVDWLDAARYADSYGFQVDRDREVWPWRDWVVRAFNANMPLDQFITWQLAGDLLPEATDEQILATAFNRMHQQESEGGSVEEEYRVEYVCDRVQTFATTFLGLTMECARCHDHKYDPITQREYYQFFSLFQNIDEAGLYSYFTQSTPTPGLPLADAPAKQRVALLKAKVAEVEERMRDERGSHCEAFTQWLADPHRQIGRPSKKSPADTIPSPALAWGEIARFDFDAIDKDKLANTIDAEKPATLRGENRLVPGRHRQAVEFSGDDPVDLPVGNFARHEPFSLALWLKTPDVKDRAVVFHRSRAWTDAASRGYELLIEDGHLKWSLIHFWPGNAISVAGCDPLPPGEWVHVVVSSDGSSRAAGLRMSIGGRPAKTIIAKDHLTKEITGGGNDNIALGERFRDRGFKGGQIDELRVFSRDLTALETLETFDEATAQALLAKPVQLLADDERELLFDYYLTTQDEQWRGSLDALRSARGELTKVEDGIRDIMVMRELEQPKKAYVLFRGEYGERRDEVQGGTPAFLPPLNPTAPRNRLGLAQWLTDRGHPLTARVAVNRAWQSLLGRGLVTTAENFGSQGSRPLYPEVLDWLALGLIDSGWNLKQLIKTIVVSQTYRQQSTVDAKAMAEDPDNERLARGPRVRLPAEMIRDNALAAGGLLKKLLGGPPVNPYEMSEAFKPAQPSEADGVYRRSLYTTWRRTAPPPALVAFDAPRRAVCIARRERTDSPLQALVLLNGVQFVEAARVLGESLHRDAQGDVRAMIERGFLRCLSRPADGREFEILAHLYQEQLEYFTAHAADAEQLLAIGRAPRDAAIPIAHAAAATVLAQTLLNHDECIMKR
jgi:Protein of unknown function (DUF1549)/Protein of unknown function (DUF1553)/Concanavalin A-like lectin/glucanases superfamily/Planctomycete cytochrome C